MARIFRAAFKLVIGTALGLVFAEVMFLWNDQGAFPHLNFVGSSRVDLQACKLEYSIVSPK